MKRQCAIPSTLLKCKKSNTEIQLYVNKAETSEHIYIHIKTHKKHNFQVSKSVACKGNGVKKTSAYLVHHVITKAHKKV